MKIIKLSKNKETIVDDEDYEYLNQWKWSYLNVGYATRGTWPDKKTLLMHRVITNAPKGKHVDHINHNTLDNRKSNLRICTQKQNSRGQKLQQNKSSVYKGVHWNKNNKNWRAKIVVDGKSINLGSYKKEEDAAIAYNKAAILYFGEFAYLNVLNKKD